MTEPSILAQRLRGDLDEIDASMARALGESVGSTSPVVATTGGDPELLRGIPVVGAVAGVMRGTRPDQVVR